MGSNETNIDIDVSDYDTLRLEAYSYAKGSMTAGLIHLKDAKLYY